MKCDDIINLVGLGLNLGGVILVGIAGTKYMICVHTALLAHEMTIETLVENVLGRGNVVQFTGLDRNRDKYFKIMGILTFIGLTVIVIGFILQVVALLLSSGIS